ncbi:MAG: bifunctional folylpolyglutamate synthase/dihydrofolate synthase [Clostridiales bacterium]|nr:bifunctional folylpolyglutamate synthase/dihydrofolate synthase [Clostridiales bacterium]
MSYESTLAYIHQVSWRGQKPGLSRTRDLLAALGSPERQLRFVHIAGTNGKGSTAACLASILQAAGYRVGLYTSPFLNRFNERVQVNGVPISDEDLEQVVDEIRPHADAMADAPTEFELITALGFLYFARQRCDIVVLEVGLGGELDSTNVIPAPECAVITALGMDHVRELGPTLADIARAKAGIIKPGTTVVSYGGAPEADEVIAAKCRETGCPLIAAPFQHLTVHSTDLDGCRFDFDGLQDLTIPLLGAYQPKNAAVAVTAARVLKQRGWQISDEAIRRGLASVSWPGRFELLSRSPMLILDGSHNPHGMRATVDSLRAVFPGETFVFLLSVMADKDYPAMLDLLAPLAKEFFTVTANTPRALDAQALAEACRARGVPATACGTIPQGLAAALEAGRGGVTVALGTLYFSGDVRQAFLAGQFGQ